MRKLKDSTSKTKKLRASQNKAKDVETPKIKCIAIPNAARAEIIRANQEIDTYLSGVATGMGIKGKWRVDIKTMQFIVEDK